MNVNIGQLVAKIAGMVAVFGLALFLPAGTLAWPAAWAFLVLFFVFVVALSLWLLQYNPDLLAERLTGIGRPDQKAWDKALLAFRENAYLSPAVRVQRERGQTVVSTGPYHYVRHPMYAGFLLFTLGTALLLGSWYGLLGGLALIGMVARRAVLEEQVLREELPGYRAYMERVRCRLVPHLW